MIDDSDASKIILEKKRRLQKLRETQAKMGVSTPPHILTEIEDIEEELINSQIIGSKSSPRSSRKTSRFQRSLRSPLSVENLLAGIIITVIGGIILAVIIRYERPSPPTSTVVPVVVITATPSQITPTATNPMEVTIVVTPTEKSTKEVVNNQPQETTMDCALSTNLQIGSVASMNDIVPNRVRSQPNSNASIVGELTQNDLVTVIDGPRCIKNPQGQKWIYWKIKAVDKNLVGWTPEGSETEYWLVPLKISQVRFCSKNEFVNLECTVSREVFTIPVTEIYISWVHNGFTKHSYIRRWSKDGQLLTGLTKTGQVWEGDNASNYTWVKYNAGLDAGAYTLEFVIRDDIPPIQSASFLVRN